MIVKNKIYIFALTFVAAVLLHISIPVQASAQSCIRNGKRVTFSDGSQGYDDNVTYADATKPTYDFTYKWRFIWAGIVPSDNQAVYPGNGSYVQSSSCSGNYQGSSSGDTVNPSTGLFGMPLSPLAGARTVRPIKVDLGIRPDNIKYGGVDRGYDPTPIGTPSTPPKNVCVGLNTSLDPHIVDCNYTFDNRNRYGAFVDDSGRLLINNTLIWCEGLRAGVRENGGSGTAVTGAACPTDIVDPAARTTYPIPSTGYGAGFLFRADQCVVGNGVKTNIVPLGAPGPFTIINSFLGCVNYGGWIRPYSAGFGYDITSKFPREASTGYLNSFGMHYDTRNTHKDGFAVFNAFSLAYPTNNGKCSVTTASPGVITMRLTNLGTRPWRGTDGYVIRKYSIAGAPITTGNTPGGFINGKYSLNSDLPTNSPLTQGNFKNININDTIAAGEYYKISQDRFQTLPAPHPVSSSPSFNNEISNYEDVDTCPNPDLNCSITTNPSIVGPGDSFTATVTIKYTGSTAYVYKKATNRIDIAMTGLAPTANNVNYTQFGKSAPPPVISTSTTWTSGIVSSATPGTYTVTVTVADPNGAVFDCSNSIDINTTPYVRFYGSDISAGASAGCAGWPIAGNMAANVRGFSGASDATRGSGAQLGIFATGVIDNSLSSSIFFSSAQLRTSAPVGSSLGLDFANTGAGSPGNFGGSHCPHNYWGDSVSAPTVGNNLNVGALPSGDYYRNGDLTIVASNIPNSRKVKIFVNGNVVINGNIIYTGQATWAVAGEIPSLTIVAHGDIRIDPTVSQLDGTFVAQPNGATGGTINTCTAVGVVPGNLATRCNRQLVVNGSFIAKTILWHRTFGSISGSLGTSEYPGGAPSKAAEIINFGPEGYISTGSGYSPDYETNLPPIL